MTGVVQDLRSDDPGRRTSASAARLYYPHGCSPACLISTTLWGACCDALGVGRRSGGCVAGGSPKPLTTMRTFHQSLGGWMWACRIIWNRYVSTFELVHGGVGLCAVATPCESSKCELNDLLIAAGKQHCVTHEIKSTRSRTPVGKDEARSA